MHPSLNIDPETLAQFCQRHHIRRLSLFGSQLKGTAGPDSDIDLLVEFDPEHIPGLLGIAAMEIELSELLGGRKVDLRTAADRPAIFATRSCARPRCNMLDEDRIRIGHMVEAAEEALRFIANRNRSDLDTDRMLLFALVRAVEIIGEAATKVTDETVTPTQTFPGNQSLACGIGWCMPISISTPTFSGSPPPWRSRHCWHN